MTDLELKMAQHFYGYGRWEAPYWFIGPEQGQGKSENDKLGARADAWNGLGRPELADLKRYHDLLEPGKHTHDGAAFVPTWRRLILALKAYQMVSTEKEALRDYQCKRLGRVDKNGETCLLELSGLPARDSRVARDRELFLKERKTEIAHRIRLHSPQFVLMYGAMQREHWQQVAGGALEIDRVRKIGRTAFLYTRHPARDGRPDTHWKEIGLNLKQAT